jgi:hypothetical protein
VRVEDIQQVDLNVFQFDYDLTMMIFFLGPDQQVYGRYGGRDARGPDRRQSLAGLRYAIRAALSRHEAGQAPLETARPPLTVRDLAPGRRGGCVHCHQVNEMSRARDRAAGNWSLKRVWRYPLPDNLGLLLDVDQGDVVKSVFANSAAETAGLQPGDRVERLHNQPVHSLGDAQFALDRAPESGPIDIEWTRNGQPFRGQLAAAPGWRRGDIRWRRSLVDFIASARLSGSDLTAAEKQELGLDPDRLAFRQKPSVPPQARQAGIEAGDIILGFEDMPVDMNAYAFQRYVQRHYVVGEQVTVNLIRAGLYRQIRMTLK